MSRYNTYGMSPETIEKVSDAIYENMLLRTSSKLLEGNKDFEEIADTLINRPIASKALIVTSLVFGIGNFDRIDKIELDAEMNEKGELEKPREVRREYVS